MTRKRGAKNSRKYRVGRGKPPQNNQFQPGESGNLKGRPKGSKNIGKVLAKELSKPIIVTENGARRRVDKTTAMVMRLVQKALEGDQKSISSLVSMIERNSPKQEEEEELPPSRVELALLRKCMPYLEGLARYVDQLDDKKAA